MGGKHTCDPKHGLFKLPGWGEPSQAHRDTIASDSRNSGSVAKVQIPQCNREYLRRSFADQVRRGHDGEDVRGRPDAAVPDSFLALMSMLKLDHGDPNKPNLKLLID